MEKYQIIIASHLKCDVPQDVIYVPLQVGAEGKEPFGFRQDNQGENISSYNAYFCELTGLYWAWKNLNSEYLGLVHYRRYFRGSMLVKLGGKNYKILSRKNLDRLLGEQELILPRKRHYFIETNESQYIHAHHSIGLKITRDVLLELYPEYMDAWNTTMKLRSGHRFNMFIMKKTLCDDYCEWLFSILFSVQSKIDIRQWNKSEQRIFGYLAERLLDVWLIKNKLPYKEVRYIFIGKQHWGKKISGFIKRKFVRKSDETSCN